MIIRRQLKVNYSNKGQEFPEITKVFLPGVACGSTRCPTGSVKRPDPNCQLSWRRYCNKILFYLALSIVWQNRLSCVFTGMWEVMFVFTVQAIRNITFTNSREFLGTFSKFIKNYEFRVQSSHANLRTNSCTNSNSWKQKKKFVHEFQKFVHEFWRKKVICVQIWTNQLDCIKTEIQRHHLLIIIWLVFKK